jgi:hypothetical protein
MIFRTPQLDITKIEVAHCASDKTKPVLMEVHNESLLVSRNRTDEIREPPTLQAYWFRCPACNFDWREWVKSSITFISLSFITDICPNCKRRHVPAYQMGFFGTGG